CSPTCVGLRYGRLLLARGFSWQCEPMTFATEIFAPHHSLALSMSGFAYSSASLLGRTSISPRHFPPASPLRSESNTKYCYFVSIHLCGLRRYRNFHLLSFDYAFRPRLRSRLTLRGRTFLRKPWAFGGRDSHPSYRYSFLHSHFRYLHGSLRYRFVGIRNAPLPNAAWLHWRSFGV